MLNPRNDALLTAILETSLWMALALAASFALSRFVHLNDWVFDPANTGGPLRKYVVHFNWSFTATVFLGALVMRSFLFDRIEYRRSGLPDPGLPGVYRFANLIFNFFGLILGGGAAWVFAASITNSLHTSFEESWAVRLPWGFFIIAAAAFLILRVIVNLSGVHRPSRLFQRQPHDLRSKRIIY